MKMFAKSVHPGSVWVSPVAGTQVLDRAWGALKKFLPPRIGVKRELKGPSCMDPPVKRMLSCGARELLSAHSLQRSSGGPLALTVCEHSETRRPNDDVVRLGISRLSSKTKVVRDVPKSRVRTVFWHPKCPKIVHFPQVCYC